MSILLILSLILLILSSLRSYTWMKDCDVNLWAFKEKNPGMMKGLQEELDPDVWVDVAAKLGLTNQQIEVRMLQT